MPDKPDYYDFGGIRLFTADTHLEVPATGKEYTPSRNHRNFLLVLVRKAPAVVTYEDLWREVWRSKSAISATDLRNIQTTKGSLTNWLNNTGIKTVIIEAQPGEGYRLANEVVPGWMEPDAPESLELNTKDEGETIGHGLTFDSEVGDLEISDSETAPCEIEHAPVQFGEPSAQIDTAYITDTNSNAEEKSVESRKEIFRSYAGYIIPVGTVYGVLFLIAAVMEIAYRFDLYGREAIIWGLILTVINASALITACWLIIYRLYYGKNAFLISAGILLGAAAASILLSTSFLPFRSITEASFQTQPAFTAFGKNVLIYFLPLGIGFLLLPFYIVAGRRMIESGIRSGIPSDTILVKPKLLLFICLGMIIVSYLSSNYMLDKLNTGSDYHAIFVGAVMMRMVVYFGLELSSIAWYYTKTSEKQFT